MADSPNCDSGQYEDNVLPCGAFCVLLFNLWWQFIFLGLIQTPKHISGEILPFPSFQK